MLAPVGAIIQGFGIGPVALPTGCTAKCLPRDRAAALKYVAGAAKASRIRSRISVCSGAETQPPAQMRETRRLKGTP